jgi:hypothetical protein
VSFDAITLCVASQQVFLVLLLFISLSTQSGNFWIYPRTSIADTYLLRQANTQETW